MIGHRQKNGLAYSKPKRNQSPKPSNSIYRGKTYNFILFILYIYTFIWFHISYFVISYAQVVMQSVMSVLI